MVLKPLVFTFYFLELCEGHTYYPLISINKEVEVNSFKGKLVFFISINKEVKVQFIIKVYNSPDGWTVEPVVERSN